LSSFAAGFLISLSSTGNLSCSFAKKKNQVKIFWHAIVLSAFFQLLFKRLNTFSVVNFWTLWIHRQPVGYTVIRVTEKAVTNRQSGFY
jgi:hypothetical protein